MHCKSIQLVPLRNLPNTRLFCSEQCSQIPLLLLLCVANLKHSLFLKTNFAFNVDLGSQQLRASASE